MPVNSRHITAVHFKVACIDTLPGTAVTHNEASNIHAFKDKIDWSNTAKATISKLDSTFWVRGDIRKDYRIIGYEKPSFKSRSLILFSVFTRDVKDNPLKCLFGSYYSTADMTFKDKKLKFVRFEGSFAKVLLMRGDTLLASLYFPKSWVELSD